MDDYFVADGFQIVNKINGDFRCHMSLQFNDAIIFAFIGYCNLEYISINNECDVVYTHDFTIING